MRAFPDLVALASLSTELGDVKICLNVLMMMIVSVRACPIFLKKMPTHLDQNQTTQQSFPRVIVVIVIFGVQEQRPLIAGNGEFTCVELMLDSSEEDSSR